jgi:hypothetical protein
MASAWDDLTPTADETVRIEEQRPGYVRYQANDGRRWEVRGVCDRRGDCLIGAVIATPYGPTEILSHSHIEYLRGLLGTDRLDSELDVPVGPGFSGCCPLEITELIRNAD